jgi:integrase
MTRSTVAARKRAGLGQDVIFHTLRHTFASWYMINGGDVYRLKGYMGHCDLKLTERYAHLSPAHRKAGEAFLGAPEARIHTEDTNAQTAGRKAPATP